LANVRRATARHDTILARRAPAGGGGKGIVRRLRAMNRECPSIASQAFPARISAGRARHVTDGNLLNIAFRSSSDALERNAVVNDGVVVPLMTLLTTVDRL
jgi:hypothetical protein